MIQVCDGGETPRESPLNQNGSSGGDYLIIVMCDCRSDCL